MATVSRQFQGAFLRRQIGSFFTLVFLLSCLGALRTPAQTQTNPDEFPPNPLELKIPDPLLPEASGMPLTPQRQQELAAALDGLNLQAEGQLQTGNSVAAFDIWNRELRLRRALGPQAEVRALGRVGGIAWRENQATQVRLITERLQKIQQQTQTQPLAEINEQYALQQALGRAYLQVRSKELALGVYQQILIEVRQSQDPIAEEAVLVTIGQLYLNWFDYPNAATTYQEVLPLVRVRNARSIISKPTQSTKPAPRLTPTDPTDPASENQPPETRKPYVPLTEADVLQRLAYIYQEDRQLQQAIATQQQLVDLLQKQKQVELIPVNKLAIAINYQTLGQLDQAIVNYQQAYILAQPLQQYGYASDALKRLAELYRSQDQTEAALRIYQFLLDVEQQSYNAYGSMMVYDQMAQLYLVRQEFPQALNALQQGLALARQLKYREDYFTNQIQELMQKNSSRR